MSKLRLFKFLTEALPLKDIPKQKCRKIASFDDFQIFTFCTIEVAYLGQKCLFTLERLYCLFLVNLWSNYVWLLKDYNQLFCEINSLDTFLKISHSGALLVFPCQQRLHFKPPDGKKLTNKTINRVIYCFRVHFCTILFVWLALVVNSTQQLARRKHLFTILAQNRRALQFLIPLQTIVNIGLLPYSRSHISFSRLPRRAVRQNRIWILKE